MQYQNMKEDLNSAVLLIILNKGTMTHSLYAMSLTACSFAFF